MQNNNQQQNPQVLALPAPAGQRGTKRDRAQNAGAEALHQVGEPVGDDKIAIAQAWQCTADAEAYYTQHPLDPTTDATYDELYSEWAMQAQHLHLHAASLGEDARRKMTERYMLCGSFSRHEGDLELAFATAAICLLPFFQVAACYMRAMTGKMGMRREAPGRFVEIWTETKDGRGERKTVHTSLYEERPWMAECLRALIAHCASAATIEALRAFALANGLDPEDFAHGDTAFAPFLIWAPARMGKTAIAIAVLLLGRRLGFTCTYGVAPHTKNVTRELHMTLVHMGLWKTDGSGLLGRCINLADPPPGPDGKKRTGEKLILPGETWDVVLYSSSNAVHQRVRAAYIEERKVKLEPTMDAVPRREGDNMQRATVLPAASGNLVFLHLHDEVQTMARVGAERERANLEEADTQLANALLNQQHIERGLRQGDLDEANALVEQAKAHHKVRVEALKKKLDGVQEQAYKSMTTSSGLQVCISATQLAATQVTPLYGTTLLNPDTLPEAIRKLGQDHTTMPTLMPASKGDFKSISSTQSVQYDAAFTPELVHKWFWELVDRRVHIQTSCLKQQARELGLPHGDEGLVATRAGLRDWQAELKRVVKADHASLISPLLDADKAVSIDGAALWEKSDYMSPVLPDMRKVGGRNFVAATFNAAKPIALIESVIGPSPGETDRIYHCGAEPPEGEKAYPLIAGMTVMSIKRTVNSTHKHDTMTDISKLLVDVCIAKNQPCVIAQWGTGMTKDNLRAAFKNDIDFHANFGTPESRKNQVTAFVVGPKAGGRVGLMSVQGAVPDMAAVTELLRGHAPTLEEASKFMIVLLGYGMFDGALTLTHQTTWDAVEVDADGERNRVQRGVMFSPNLGVFACTGGTNIESRYQTISRAHADFCFPAPAHNLRLLCSENTMGDLILTADIEAKHRAVCNVPAGHPLSGEAPQVKPEPPAKRQRFVLGGASGAQPPAPVEYLVHRKMHHEAIDVANGALQTAAERYPGIKHSDPNKLKCGKRGKTIAQVLQSANPASAAEVEALPEPGQLNSDAIRAALAATAEHLQARKAAHAARQLIGRAANDPANWRFGTMADLLACFRLAEWADKQNSHYTNILGGRFVDGPADYANGIFSREDLPLCHKDKRWATAGGSHATILQAKMPGNRNPFSAVNKMHEYFRAALDAHPRRAEYESHKQMPIELLFKERPRALVKQRAAAEVAANQNIPESIARDNAVDVFGNFVQHAEAPPLQDDAVSESELDM